MQERQHLITLCERFGVAPPEKEADHFIATFNSFQYAGNNMASLVLTAFMYTIPERSFCGFRLKKVPVDWMSQTPGQVIVAAHTTIVAAAGINYDENVDLSSLSTYFADNPVIGSKVTGGAASVFTDFRIHVDGLAVF